MPDMNAPPITLGPAYAVTCHTCYRKIWEGDIAPADGQPILTAYAEQAAGTACPSKVDPCPHKTAEVAKRALAVPATLGDLATIKTRLSAVEAKVKP